MQQKPAYAEVSEASNKADTVSKNKNQKPVLKTIAHIKKGC